jgi:hypothetical protein
MSASLGMALAFLSCIAVFADAKERRLPEAPFRFALDGEAGLKNFHGEGFQLDYGLVFKIRERYSIIPRFGFQPYQYKENGNPYFGGTTMITMNGTALNICVAFRYEFLKRLTTENTRYEYNADKREFNHYYYASAVRPYAQVIAGTFTGFGGGISYYLAPQISVGAGADMGWNWLAASDHKTGFAIIAPKAVVTFAFN